MAGPCDAAMFHPNAKITPTSTGPRLAPGALLRARLERMYRGTIILTFGGGTNEVQRDIIAMVGLGMPRGR